MFIKIFVESVIQGFNQLVTNRLRSVLSLLGITIGIFSIVAVQATLDSMQRSVISNFNQLGNNVLYITDAPWVEDRNMNREKYERFPAPSYQDFEALKSNLSSAEYVSFASFTGVNNIQFNNSIVEGGFMMGVSPDYGPMVNLEIAEGRYFNINELQSGSNKVVLGSKMVDQLFNDIDPINKYIKLRGQKYQVIGVIKEDGDNMFTFLPYDIVIMVSLNNFRMYQNIDDDRNGRMLGISATSSDELNKLENEAISVLRASRLLKPLEENNFFVNGISMLQDITKNVFGQLSIAGVLIGIFALIVGLFSVANIMFVSVKERTNIIGIKKALGAKSGVILLEFLVESVILCLLGGAAGILLVYFFLLIVNQFTNFNVGLTFENAVLGLLISLFTGILSGFLPAFGASRMDPVEAMRK